MASGLYNWSQTAAINSGSDSAINWAEGQAPSSVNDSARAMMAVIKKHDDDIAGAIVTGGTSTAYTVTSYSVFDTLAHMNGQMIAFSPHTTNGATVTLNVDGLGAKPLRPSPSVELLAGTLVQGTPYTALYNHSDQVFYLHGFYGNAYNVPLMGGMDYWDTIAPNSSFIFPAGQAISRTTYAAVFARWGTTYGVGDGSTTFNVPDKTGRASVMKEATATRLTSAVSGIDGATMGAAGGAQSHSLTVAQSPTLTSTGTGSATAPNSQNYVTSTGTEQIDYQAGSTNRRIPLGTTVTANASGANVSVTTTTSGTGGATGGAHNNVQPTIVCNYIIRII